MDLVIMGGNVLTMDSHNSRAEAVAVEEGKVAAVGSNAELSKLVGETTEVVHLAGRTLLPGFIDPHNHFSISSLEPVAVDCSVPPHATINSIADTIADAAKDLPPGRWLRGWGLRTGRLKENRAITRWELDEAAPDNPVCIMDGSVHACYANSAALSLAGIDRNTPTARAKRLAVIRGPADLLEGRESLILGKPHDFREAERASLGRK